MKLTISLLASVFVIASCKKEEPTQPPCEPVVVQNYSNDTIFPSDYIMAYPGSWWEYNDGFIDSCTSWEPVPLREVTTFGDCIHVDESQCIVPTGLFYAEKLANRSRNTNNGEHITTIFTPLVDTTIGVFYEEQFTGGSGNYSYKDDQTVELLERLDSMVIGTNIYYDVLHVKHVSDIYYWHVHGGPLFIQEFWFSKNVGLIKWIRQENGSIYEDRELVTHYIAPH